MASSPITSWQIDGKTMEKVTDFIFLGSKITADGDCSHEIKRLFLLGRKAMTNLDSELKSRDITLLTEVHLVKAMVFPVVIYGYDCWTIKKAECQRTEAFELWFGEENEGEREIPSRFHLTHMTHKIQTTSNISSHPTFQMDLSLASNSFQE